MRRAAVRPYEQREARRNQQQEPEVRPVHVQRFRISMNRVAVEEPALGEQRHEHEPQQRPREVAAEPATAGIFARKYERVAWVEV